jgi:hypothetical protein
MNERGGPEISVLHDLFWLKNNLDRLTVLGLVIYNRYLSGTFSQLWAGFDGIFSKSAWRGSFDTYSPDLELIRKLIN